MTDLMSYQIHLHLLVQQGREQKGEKDCSYGDAVGGKDEWKTKANEYKNKNKHTKY